MCCFSCVRGCLCAFFPHRTADVSTFDFTVSTHQPLQQHQVLIAVKAFAEAGSAATAAAPPPPPATGDDGALAAWEAQSVLLLWLSILILTPFDLRTVDSAVGADEGTCGGGGGVTPLAARILELCQGYLEHPGERRWRTGKTTVHICTCCACVRTLAAAALLQVACSNLLRSITPRHRA